MAEETKTALPEAYRMAIEVEADRTGRLAAALAATAAATAVTAVRSATYSKPVGTGEQLAADAGGEPKPNIRLSKGKNPATGEPWPALESVILGGTEKPVKLPAAEVQAAGFYHPRAAEIAAAFGNYKLIK